MDEATRRAENAVAGLNFRTGEDRKQAVTNIAQILRWNIRRYTAPHPKGA